METVPGTIDSLHEERHKKYKIGNVYVNIDYKEPGTTAEQPDTVEYNGIYFIQTGTFSFTPRALERAIFINKGGYYLLKDEELTYRRLSSLRNFKYINIGYEISDETNANILDCNIKLVPVKNKSFSIETNGTNSGGNLGVEGTIGYQDLNTFKRSRSVEHSIQWCFGSTTVNRRRQ